MGFMDKAKKLAEQAQQKLDEVQQNVNETGAPKGGEQTGQRFDEHGRPVEEGPPAGQTPAPAAEPAPPASDSNASPDPFKPLDK